MSTDILTDTHICNVDCEPIIITDVTTGEKRQGHIMYPADPTPHAGRYQATLNLTQTRREFRESGQDESRNVRLWNEERRIAKANGTYRLGERAMRRRDMEVEMYAQLGEMLIP